MLTSYRNNLIAFFLCNEGVFTIYNSHKVVQAKIIETNVKLMLKQISWFHHFKHSSNKTCFPNFLLKKLKFTTKNIFIWNNQKKIINFESMKSHIHLKKPKN